MADEIALKCTLNVEAVPSGGEPRMVYLLVDTSPGAGAELLQAPVNMAMVLDVSESMRLPVLTQEQFQILSKMGHVSETISDGVPVWAFKNIPQHIRKNAPSNLEAVQAAVAQSTRHFEAHDRLSLVAFADHAEVLLSGVSGSEQRQMLDAITHLGSTQLGDETNMGDGLRAGIDEVLGNQKPDMLNRLLVLTDGFTRDPERVKELAGEARRSGMAVSTLGIGTEFNEELLVHIADASLGNAYFARIPADIPPVFAQELAAVQEITARGLEIMIRLSTGVEMRRAYRVRPAISLVRDAKQEDRSTSVPVGDLHPASPPALLVELLVPAQKDGVYRIAQVSATHSDSPGGENAVRNDVVLKYAVGNGRVEPNPRVMNTVERVSAYVLQTKALSDVATGNKAAATQKLKAAATRLLSIGETTLARAVEEEATRLDGDGEVSPEAAKELRYATRKLTRLK